MGAVAVKMIMAASRTNAMVRSVNTAGIRMGSGCRPLVAQSRTVLPTAGWC